MNIRGERRRQRECYETRERGKKERTGTVEHEPNNTMILGRKTTGLTVNGSRKLIPSTERGRDNEATTLSQRRRDKADDTKENEMRWGK